MRQRARIWGWLGGIVVGGLLALTCSSASASAATLTAQFAQTATVGQPLTITVSGNPSEDEGLYLYVSTVDASCPAMPSGIFDNGSAEGEGDATLADGTAEVPGPFTSSYSYTPPNAGGPYLVCGYLDVGENGTPDVMSAGSFTASQPAPTPSPSPGPNPSPSPSPSPPVSRPINQTTPTVTGKPIVGYTLAASMGRWTGAQPIEYTYQWERCSPACHEIPRATNQRYMVGGDEVADTLRVIVTASNASGARTAASKPTLDVLEKVCGLHPCLLDESHGAFVYRPPLLFLTRNGKAITKFVGGQRFLTVPHAPIPSSESIHWVTWTQKRAIGIGNIYINSCQPSCGRGTFASYAAFVVASAPRNDVFTRLSIIFMVGRRTVRLNYPLRATG